MQLILPAARALGVALAESVCTGANAQCGADAVQLVVRRHCGTAVGGYGARCVCGIGVALHRQRVADSRLVELLNCYGPVFRLQRLAGTMGQPHGFGRGLWQPAPAQPVCHAYQHRSVGPVVADGAAARLACPGLAGAGGDAFGPGQCGQWLTHGLDAMGADRGVDGRLAPGACAACVGGGHRRRGVLPAGGASAAVGIGAFYGLSSSGLAGAVAGRRGLQQPPGAVGQRAAPDRAKTLAGLGLGRAGLRALHHALSQ